MIAVAYAGIRLWLANRQINRAIRQRFIEYQG